MFTIKWLLFEKHQALIAKENKAKKQSIFLILSLGDKYFLVEVLPLSSIIKNYCLLGLASVSRETLTI